MSAATKCSECGAPTKAHEAAGRPRETCGPTCARNRDLRTKRERRAWQRYCRLRDREILTASENAPALVENEADQRALDEFNHWATTGVWPEGAP